MMHTSQTIFNLFLLPTGDFQNPVCVGDMQSHRYQVSIHAITEEVISYLDKHLDVPGVILMDGDNLHGMIPRVRIFERLGHPYGVELFLRKPIIELQQNLGTRVCTISSNLRIHDAVSVALNRPSEDVYDPLVVDFDGSEMRLLDVHTLLVAQSQSLHGMNNLMGSLTRLEQTVRSGSPLEQVLDLSMASLRKVVPFHKVAIHLTDPHAPQLLGRHHTLHPLNGQLTQNKVFQTILSIRQPLHVEDVNIVPAWEKLDLFGQVHSWMGAPLLNSYEPFGVLSLVRHSRSPFNKDEMNMTVAFAELISRAFHQSIPVLD